MSTLTQNYSKPTHLAGGIYASFAHLASMGQSPFLLLIRVYIGWQCAKSGYGHITHFDQTVDYFKSLNIPFPKENVVFSAMTEMVGGSLLALGFLSRLMSLALVGNFLVAFFAANLGDSHDQELLRNFWNNQNVLLNDTSFPFLMTSIIVLFFGPGFFSIDTMLRSKLVGGPIEAPRPTVV
jgi:putative oxidoreductase